MFFQINGLEISQLEKAKAGVIPVRIIANHLTEDTDGETLLKSAFDKETVQTFLNVGVIDWWHNSKNGDRTDAEQAEAIIGKPTGFKWEGGKPTVYADLTEEHPIVQKMLPNLRADQPVYAGSVGGSKIVLKVNDGAGQEKRIIPRVKWDHLAIAPSNSVINREPGVNIRMMRKANDVMVEFDNMALFQTQSDYYFGKEEELKKALMAPESASDLYETPGGVITKQSLKKTVTSLTFGEDEALLFLDTVLGLRNNKVPMQKEALSNYFELKGQRDFGDKFYRLIDKYFNKKGATL